jgi:hypothetical protein
MAGRSAGILPYRRRGTTLEVLLVHPGGPLWAQKDDGAWSISKGETEQGHGVWSLSEEYVGVRTDRKSQCRRRGPAGARNDLRVGPGLAHLGDSVAAFLLRHDDIGDDEVRLLAATLRAPSSAVIT